MLGVFAPLTASAQSEPALQDGSWIQPAIEKAIRNGDARLVIPAGVYELQPYKPAEKRSFHLELVGAKDFELDATGVTFVFAGRAHQSVRFLNCTNVTFRGATLRRGTSSVSQGTIEAVREGGKSIDVRIDAGYPADIDNRELFSTFWANVFTMDRKRWLAHYRAATPPGMEKLEPNLWRVRMSQTADEIGVPLKTGQPLAWRGEVFSDVRVQNCGSMKLVDVTVAGGSGMCFHEIGGEGGNVYKRCRVIPGQTPPGATHAPLLSSSADGFHSNDARTGPTIEDCLFEAPDDDAIAIHGYYACVVETRDSSVVIMLAPNATNRLYARVGDQVRFTDENGSPNGERTVRSVRTIENYAPPAGFRLSPEYRMFQNVGNPTHVELTLDAPIDARQNWLASNANETGSGYVIRNTVIRDGGARGIMAKASNGLIEGCTIERTARAAIELMPEHLLWPESDFVRDVVVRNNVIRDVSLNRQDGFLRHPGAVTLYAYRAGREYVAGAGHRNVVIEGNTFDSNQGPNLLIATADGVIVRNNRFIHPMSTPSVFGNAKGVDPDAMLWITRSRNVSLWGNVVVSPGDGMKQLVGIGAGVEQVNGVADGFVIERAK